MHTALPASLMYQARFGHKCRIEVKNAIVVSPDPLATRAAVDVLKEGGNACDATLAAAAMHLVTEPHMTSLTGGLSMLYRDANTGNACYLNGNVSAPLAPLPGFCGADLYTGRGVPVPGWWPAFEAAHARWGTLSHKRLLNPAIFMAREGFPMDPYLYGVMYGRQEGLGAHSQGREVFWPKGNLLTQGDTIVQTRVARTLERLRDEGMDYYRGDFARAFCAECARGGGVITQADFDAVQPLFQQPVEGRYRDQYTIIGSPAPDDGGMMLIEALNLIEQIDLAALGPCSESFSSLQWLLHIHNEVYYAPPRHGDLETAPEETRHLLSKGYALQRFQRLCKDVPTRSGQTMPTAGTIHLAVVDKDRNIASCTHSHMASAWPNGLSAEGFPLSGGGSFFQRVMPTTGGRATVYLAPNIILRNGEPVIVSGSPSVSLVACILQNIVNLIDFGMDIETSVHQPRFGTRPHNPQFGWEQGNTLECGFPEHMQQQFVQWAKGHGRWHQLVHPRSVLTGNFEAITIDPATGRLASCADPRRCGWVEGY